jgi:hypothetical protein
LLFAQRKVARCAKGHENALIHGFYTAEAIAERLYVRMLLKRAKDQMAELRN